MARPLPRQGGAAVHALRSGTAANPVAVEDAAERRDRLLQGVPTKAGYDREKYPPAVGRGRGHGLTRGSNPTGWMADVEYVPSSENRSHGYMATKAMNSLRITSPAC